MATRSPRRAPGQLFPALAVALVLTGCPQAKKVGPLVTTPPASTNGSPGQTPSGMAERAALEARLKPALAAFYACTEVGTASAQVVSSTRPIFDSDPFGPGSDAPPLTTTPRADEEQRGLVDLIAGYRVHRFTTASSFRFVATAPDQGTYVPYLGNTRTFDAANKGARQLTDLRYISGRSAFTFDETESEATGQLIDTYGKATFNALVGGARAVLERLDLPTPESKGRYEMTVWPGPLHAKGDFQMRPGATIVMENAFRGPALTSSTTVTDAAGKVVLELRRAPDELVSEGPTLQMGEGLTFKPGVVGPKIMLNGEPIAQLSVASTYEVIGLPGTRFEGWRFTVGPSAQFEIAAERGGLSLKSFAGRGGNGFTAGDVNQATFNVPTGICVSADHIFVADAKNHRIRQFTYQLAAPAGLIITTGVTNLFGDGKTRMLVLCGDVEVLAGDGTEGTRDGAGAQAQFKSPVAVINDGAGGVYVGDAVGANVRRVNADGTTTTVAGTGVAGFADGPGAKAQFKSIQGLALDGVGGLLVSDTGNNRIRRIDLTKPGFPVTTFAGTGVEGATDGPRATATFRGPRGLSFLDGKVYVGEEGGLRLIDASGEVTTLAGGGAPGDMDGERGTAALGTLTAVEARAKGSVIFADQAARRIRSVDPTGYVRTVIGQGYGHVSFGQGFLADLTNVHGIASDPTGHFTLVSDPETSILAALTLEVGAIVIAGGGNIIVSTE